MVLPFVPLSRLGAAIIAVETVFLFLAFVAVGLRCWCAKAVVRRNYKTHDWLIFVGLVLVCGHVTDEWIAIMAGGMGHQLANLQDSTIATLLKLFFAANLTWLFSTTVVKCSVLFLYLDIFKAHLVFTRLVYGYLVFLAMFFVGFFISIFTICSPVSHQWQPEARGSCGNSVDSEIATSVINAVFDFVIVTSPIPVVLKLQLSKFTRWRVIGIFAVGYLIVLVDIARLVTTVALNQADLSYNLSGPAILTALEVQIGVINACLPTINPMFSSARRHPSDEKDPGRRHLNWIYAMSFSRRSSKRNDSSTEASRSFISSSIRRLRGGASREATPNNSIPNTSSISNGPTYSAYKMEDHELDHEYDHYNISDDDSNSSERTEVPHVGQTTV